MSILDIMETIVQSLYLLGDGQTQGVVQSVPGLGGYTLYSGTAEPRVVQGTQRKTHECERNRTLHRCKQCNVI